MPQRTKGQGSMKRATLLSDDTKRQLSLPLLAAPAVRVEVPQVELDEPLPDCVWQPVGLHRRHATCDKPQGLETSSPCSACAARSPGRACMRTRPATARSPARTRLRRRTCAPSRSSDEPRRAPCTSRQRPGRGCEAATAVVGRGGRPGVHRSPLPAERGRSDREPAPDGRRRDATASRRSCAGGQAAVLLQRGRARLPGSGSLVGRRAASIPALSVSSPGCSQVDHVTIHWRACRPAHEPSPVI